MKLKATQKPMYLNMTVSKDAVLWFVNQLLTVDVLTVVHENINAVLSDDVLCHSLRKGRVVIFYDGYGIDVHLPNVSLHGDLT
jgi:hypothetical protein